MISTKNSFGLFFWSLIVVFLTLSCGNDDKNLKSQSKKIPTLEFPHTGIVDIHAIPLGSNYKVSRVRSLSSATLNEKLIKAYFDHQFAKAGDPENGDTVNQVGDWAGIPTSQGVLTLTLRTVLALELLFDGMPKFKKLWDYTQQSASDNNWSWSIYPHHETGSGIYYHRIFEDLSNKHSSEPIYGDDSMHATLKIEGSNIIIYYETNFPTFKQLVEVTYTKQ